MGIRFLVLGLTLAIISLLAGWWRADLAASQVPSIHDEWAGMSGSDISPQQYSVIALRMKASTIFPVSREEAKRLEQEAGSATTVIEGVPAFPPIVGASVLNGVPHIHLLLEDSTFVKATSGDKLESGWQIISVDLKRVNAVYGDEEHEFLVTNYDVKPAGDEK